MVRNIYNAEIGTVKDEMKLQLDYYWMWVGSAVADMVENYQNYKLHNIGEVAVQCEHT